MKKDKKSKLFFLKAALITLAAIILLSYLAVLYVNRTLIPVKLKSQFEKALSEYTQRESVIESLAFSISKGFVLNGIRVYEGPKEDNKFLFKADRISFAVIFIPSFKKHKIIIPRINIEAPYADIKRRADGTWNISSLLKKESEQKPSAFDIKVSGLSFNDGVVLLQDNYADRDSKKSITELNGTVGLGLPDNISLNCTGTLDTVPIEIAAKYSFIKNEVIAELKAERLPIADYWNEYIAISASATDRLKIYSGNCDTAIKVYIMNLKRIDAYGKLSIKGLKAGFDGNEVTGDYGLSGDVKLNLKDLKNPEYTLELELSGASIKTRVKPLKNIFDINGLLLLSQERWQTKELSGKLNGAQTAIKAVVDSPHKELTADIELSSKLELKSIEGLNIDFKSGQADVNTKIKYQHKDSRYRVSGTSDITELKLRQEDIIVSGDFFIRGETEGILGKWDTLRYEGDMDFKKARIEGMGSLPFISDAYGEAVFSTDQINIKSLTCNAAGSKIFLSGSIEQQHKEPKLDISLKTDRLPLKKLIDTLPEKIKPGFKGMDADGICSVDAKFSGKISDPKSFTYNGSLLLKNGSLGLPFWPNNISDIDSDILFENQKITWKSLDFSIGGERYHSYGRLLDPAQPKVSFNLKTEDLNITSEINIDSNKRIKISKFDGSYRNSTFTAKGDISDLEKALARLSGIVNLDIEDIPYILKDKKDRLSKLNPKGEIKITFDMQGPLKDMPRWSLAAEGTSKAVYLSGLEFKDFYVDYRMKDNFIEVPIFVAYPYDGVINLTLRANLKTQEQPYLINIDIKDIDLQKLVMDTKLKDKKIKGTFAAKAALNGYLTKKDSMYGNGWLQVSDGYLWEFPVMRGLTEIILMVPPEYITLTDAFGNFSVKNNRVYTEDFKLLSQKASLLWVGSLGFDTTLDFSVTGRFAEDVIKQTSEPGRIANAILKEAGNLIMEVKLAGTVAEPKYQIVPFPIKRILQEKVVDKFKNIFENVF